MSERVDRVGYINADKAHVLLGFREPALLNPGDKFVQVAVTIETARDLCDKLTAFLKEHDGP